MAEGQESGRSRFGEVAENYARSQLFAAGEDLQWLVAEAALQGDEVVVDVGTAAGHTAMALAPFARQVVGVDPVPNMLERARQLATERGLHNTLFLVGAADDLPLPNQSADLVVTRYAAHHFPNLDDALREFRRVLVPGGRLLIVDVVSPPDPDLDAFLHRVEVLRDPSHVRDWSLAEWEQAAARHGFALRVARTWDLALDFQDWVERMRTPPDAVAELQRLMATAPLAARETFRIVGDPVVSFCLKSALLTGRVLA